MHNSRLGIAFSFIFIAVLLTVTAFVYYRYGGYATQIQPRLVSENIIERQYSVNLPGRGWYDTGLWIKSGQTILAKTKNNPFILTIDNYSDSAKMNDFNQFIATLTAYQERTTYTNVAVVEAQGKIYLFSDYPADIYLKIFLDAETVAKITKQKEAANQEIRKVPDAAENKDKGVNSFWNWIVWFAILIVSFIVGEAIFLGGLMLMVNNTDFASSVTEKIGTVIILIFGCMGFITSLFLIPIITEVFIWIGLYSY